MLVSVKGREYKDIQRIDFNRRGEMLLYTKDEDGDWSYLAMLLAEEIISITEE